MKRRILACLLAVCCFGGFTGCRQNGDDTSSVISRLDSSASLATEDLSGQINSMEEAGSAEEVPSESEVSSAAADASVSSTPVSSLESFPSVVPILPADDTSPAEPTPLPRDIDTILASMSLEQKVGQMFIVRVPESGALRDVQRYQFGGYILFARDFSGQTPASIRQTIASYQSLSNVPMLIGVDEEGGTVNRVSRYPAFRSTPFLSPAEVFRQGGWNALDANTTEKSDLLLSLGINLNLAPVCDLPSSSTDFIYARSFGTDPTLTGEFVRRTVTLMNEKQIGSVLKHFPGYGNNADTHTDVVHDDRDYETFVSRDFLPFSAGIEAGAGAVMVAHNIVSCMDSVYPASLSDEVHRILREDLGFSGVIMTDDLYMDGIRKYTGASEAAVVAVQAGNDMLCCTDYATQYPAVLAAVKNGTIPVEQIERSVRRILQWKQSLGILE